MKTTVLRFTLTALAYFVPTMILGMVWHFLLFENLYEKLGMYNRAAPIIPLGLASMILQGIILAWLYPYYMNNRYSFRKTIVYNLMMGLFLFSVTTLANAAKIEVSPMSTWLWIQLAFHAIQFLSSGLLMGLVDHFSAGK